MGDDARHEEIKALARYHAEDMVEVLAEVANNRDAKDAARVVAAKTLLDRGFGMPERRVEQKVDVNVYDHRQAHVNVLRRLADKRGPVNDIPDVEDAEFEEIEPSAKQKALTKVRG